MVLLSGVLTGMEVLVSDSHTTIDKTIVSRVPLARLMNNFIVTALEIFSKTRSEVATLICIDDSCLSHKFLCREMQRP